MAFHGTACWQKIDYRDRPDANHQYSNNSQSKAKSSCARTRRPRLAHQPLTACRPSTGVPVGLGVAVRSTVDRIASMPRSAPTPTDHARIGGAVFGSKMGEYQLGHIAGRTGEQRGGRIDWIRSQHRTGDRHRTPEPFRLEDTEHRMSPPLQGLSHSHG